MDKAAVFRRVLHVVSPIWLAYYLIPPDSYIGVKRELLVVGMLIVIFVAEALRIGLKLKIPGIRDYEQKRPAAYALGGLGIGLGLVFFPLPVTAVAVCGMAWVDPICWATKKGGAYPIIPLIVYFDMAVMFFLFANYYPMNSIAYGAVGSLVAIAAEKPNLKLIDDDFVMIVAPLLVLGALTYFFGGLLP